MGIFDYKRRTSTEVHIGNIAIGASNPIALQSMTNTSTMDTDGSVAQCKALADAGADIVRLTAQGVREAGNIGVIRSQLRSLGIETPLVADIHFNPKAAFAAAEKTEKVRINPGNFVDPGRTFRHLEFTDEEYAAELARINDTFGSFLDLCQRNNTAVRIGVNHGSLSDRIMSRYGDTPEGVAESAMEFLRVAHDRGFKDIVVSVKASNVVVMVNTVRLLARRMADEGMAYPFHLGVTEAGDADDGRIKSAVGIGALLSEGIGDTIRVSLSEDPVNEIPVARKIVEYINLRNGSPLYNATAAAGYDSLKPERLITAELSEIGGNRPTVIVSPKEYLLSDYEVVDGYSSLIPERVAQLKNCGKILVLEAKGPNISGEIQSIAHTLLNQGINLPMIPHVVYDSPTLDAETVKLHAAVDFGTLLLNGLRDGIWIESPHLSTDQLYELSLTILQATRVRISRTEFIACPGCGRTLFSLQETLKAVKAATSHLKGLKIGVMGCIVNGPGEMADADYGYVGAAADHISLYKGKTCVAKNIPQSEAIPHLIALLKENGDWIEP